jgi:hypothetical protein
MVHSIILFPDYKLPGPKKANRQPFLPNKELFQNQDNQQRPIKSIEEAKRRGVATKCCL